MSFAENPIGLTPFPYQRWLLIHGLELRPDGRFRFRTIVVLIARQNGKTTLIEVKNLWKLFVLRVPLVIGTAQNLDIAEESWEKAVEIIEGVPELAAELAHVDRTNGKKQLRLKGGYRWKIAAASRKGGRGLPAQDVNLDELREHQSYDAWGAVTKTTIAQPNAQTFAYSNAGDDRSLVLNDMQAKGRAAVEDPEPADPSFGYFEWSAPDECAIDDEQFWPLANPSLGYPGGVELDALRSALMTDPEPVFRTECLCQHVPTLTPTVFDRAQWSARGGLSASDRPSGPVAFGVDAAWPEAEFASIGVVGRRGDELLVQLVQRELGTSWVVPRMVELAQRHRPCAVVIDEGGPAGFLVPNLRAALEPLGFAVETPALREVSHAANYVFVGVAGDDPTLRHHDQPKLDDAVAVAERRHYGDGWTWARRGVTDISPLMAVTLGVHGVLAFGDGDLDVAGNIW